MKKLWWVMVLVVITVLKSNATVPGLINEGNKLYGNENYEAAAEIYKKALNKKELPLIYYNLGNTAFKLKEYRQALDYYNKVLNAADKNLKQKTLYNMGNTEYKREKISKAAEYWKDALILDSKDEEARHNLLVALQKEEDKGKEGDDRKGKGSEGDKESEETGKEDKARTEEELTAERILKLMENKEKKTKRKLNFDDSDFYGIDKLW